MGIVCVSATRRVRPCRPQSKRLGFVAPGKICGPPVDVRALQPGCRRPLRRDPGVERPIAVVDHAHETGLAVGQDQFGLGKPGAFLKELLSPVVQPIVGRGRRCRCVVVGGFEAESKGLVPAEVGEATAGDEVGLRLTGGVRQAVLGAEEREDGCLAVGGDAGTEAVLLVVDGVAEAFFGVYLGGVGHGWDGATWPTILQPGHGLGTLAGDKPKGSRSGLLRVVSDEFSQLGSRR
jgi:hypothetical protein